MKKILAFLLALILVLPVSFSGVLAYEDHTDLDAQKVNNNGYAWHWGAYTKKFDYTGKQYKVRLTSSSTKFVGISFVIPGNLMNCHLVFRPYRYGYYYDKIAYTVDFVNVCFSQSWTITGNYYESYTPPSSETNYILKSSLSSGNVAEYVSYDGTWRA